MSKEKVEIGLETLKSAVELFLEQKQEQEKLNQKYDERLLDTIFEEQKRYDDFARELASNKPFLDTIPNLLEEYKLGPIGQSVIWHIAYLSQDLKLVENLFTMAYEKDVNCFDRANALSLITESEADTILNYLKTKDDGVEIWLQTVINYISANRLIKHLDLFIKDGTLRFPNSYNTELSNMLIPEVINYFKNQDIKEHWYSLFLLQQPESWKVITKPKMIKEDYGDMLSRYGSPQDLPILTACIDKCKDIEDKIELLQSVGALGSIKAFTWLFEQLNHKNLKYRLAAHVEMCLFFEDEIEDSHKDFIDVASIYWDAREALDYLEDDDTSTDDDELDDMFSRKNLRGAWLGVQPAILKYRDINTRYDSSKPFDLLRTLKEARYHPDRDSIDAIIDDLMAYTGEKFPFDKRAYLVKQEEQLDVWEQYLEANREKFAPGHWYRWGERLDSGTEEITQLFE